MLMTTEEKTEGTPLYANKFKTVEELEVGYKNSLPVFQENQDLKKRLEEVSKVPESYNTPTDISLHSDDLNEIKTLAKNTGLTQAQYEKLVKEAQAKTSANVANFENAKKEMGADNINLLQDFVKKHYGDKAGEVLLTKAITDKELRESLMTARSQALNSSAPGNNKVATGNYFVTEKDILNKREEMMKSRGRGRVQLQKEYIDLQHKRAHQNS